MLSHIQEILFGLTWDREDIFPPKSDNEIQKSDSGKAHFLTVSLAPYLHSLVWLDVPSKRMVRDWSKVRVYGEWTAKSDSKLKQFKYDILDAQRNLR